MAFKLKVGLSLVVATMFDTTRWLHYIFIATLFV